MMRVFRVKFADGEVNGAVALVGESVGDDFLDVVDDFRHVLRHSRQHVRGGNVQSVHVIVKLLFPIARKFAEDGIIFDLK